MRYDYVHVTPAHFKIFTKHITNFVDMSDFVLLCFAGLQEQC